MYDVVMIVGASKNTPWNALRVNVHALYSGAFRLT